MPNVITKLRKSWMRASVKLRRRQIVLDFNRLVSYSARQTWRSLTWRGVPCIKFPTDSWTCQEILAETRPEIIVECGVRYGGATLFMADMCDLLGGGEILGVDIDLSLVHDKVREHPRITLIEGSSTAPEIVEQVRARCAGKRTMVVLDSDHSFAHVRKELDLYWSLVTPGCYLVVEDTSITYYPITPDWPDRGPYGAAQDFLAQHPEFEVDENATRLMLSGHPGGFLRRTR